MYFVGALKPFEWEQEFSPAWRFVGTKVRWSKGMMGIATAYVRRAFALVEGEEIPPVRSLIVCSVTPARRSLPCLSDVDLYHLFNQFIAVHVRRADFANLCTPGTPLSECLPPISAYARRVKQVQDEVLLRKGIIIPDDRVIVTSDERDRTWWEREVNQRGWKWFDHEAEGTVEKLGKW